MSSSVKAGAAAARAAACCAVWLLLAPASHAATLQLEVGASLSALLRRAADGDVIEIAPGDHRGQVGVIAQMKLTLRGIDGPQGRPVLHADGASAEGKAILVVRGGDIRIENLAFRGARVRDRNGAGIRFERGRLLVLGCLFADNENGLLAGNEPGAELEVRDSEFMQAPVGTPLPHLLYVGRIARFVLQGSRVWGGADGHLVKSRAIESHVRYNELADGALGRAAYELEFPNGGLAYVIGNVIGQSPTSSNPVLLSYGSEGADDRVRKHGLYVSHNTFINDGLKPAYFVRVLADKLGAPVERRLVDNLFAGIGVLSVGWDDLGQGNVPLPRALLRDPDLRAYGLGLDSWLRGRAVGAGGVRGVSLLPTMQFKPPAGTQALPATLRLSPGAVQD